MDWTIFLFCLRVSLQKNQISSSHFLQQTKQSIIYCHIQTPYWPGFFSNRKSTTLFSPYESKYEDKIHSHFTLITELLQIQMNVIRDWKPKIPTTSRFIICQKGKPPTTTNHYSQADSEDHYHYPIFKRKLMNPAKTVYPKHAINLGRTIEQESRSKSKSHVEEEKGTVEP